MGSELNQILRWWVGPELPALTRGNWDSRIWMGKGLAGEGHSGPWRLSNTEKVPALSRARREGGQRA